MTFNALYKTFETLFFFEINFMIPIFYAPILLWLAFRAHVANETSGLRMNFRGALLIHSCLNVFVALVWVLIFGENLIDHDSLWFPMFDVGAPLGMLLLLPVIPLGLIAAWGLGRKEHDRGAKNYAYTLASRVFYVISVVPSCWLILFYAGIASGK